MSIGFSSPISLAELSEERYKIQLDEAWSHERPEVKRGNRHWYEQIPCTNGGVISLFSEKDMTLAILTGKIIGKRVLQEVDGANLRLETDREIEILFPAEAIHQVAEIAGARRRRFLSSEHKAKLSEASKPYWFSPKNCVSEAQKMPRFLTPTAELEQTPQIKLIRRVLPTAG